MTFLQLQNLVAYWLDDLNFGYFTPTQVKLWLNNGQIEAQKLLLQAGENYYLKPVQTTMVINQADYVLPLDFMKLHRLEIVMTGVPPNEDTVPLAPITLNQQDLVPCHTGTPAFYYIKRNRLTLWPAPEQNLTLRLYYSPKVDDMTLDTDVPNVPEQYHEFLAVLAAMDGLVKDGRDISSLMAKKQTYVEMMKADAQERNQDVPRGIVQTGDGGGNYFGYF